MEGEDSSPSRGGGRKRASVISHPGLAGPASACTPPGSPLLLDQTGSLLRMFKSEAFDAHLHIAYLFKMRDNAGVQDYLTNELYSMPEKEMDFYLPELCLLALSRPGAEKLHAFLLDKAASRMYYAIKIHWMFQSAVEEKPPLSSQLLENAMKLYQECEMAVVNSRFFSTRVIQLRSRSISSAPGSPRISSQDASILGTIRALSRQVTVIATEKNFFDSEAFQLGEAVPSSTAHWRGGALANQRVSCEANKCNDLDLFMLKQLRCDSFNLLNNFVAQLTRLSVHLVSCTDRTRTLNLCLAQANHWLLDRRLAVALSGGEIYMTGLSLPVPWPTSEFTHIVKIHLEDCRVFRTRQRAPFAISLEVVDFSDLMGNETLAEDLSRLVLRELHQEIVGDEEKNLEKLEKVVSEIDPEIIACMLYPAWLASSCVAPPSRGETVITVTATPPTTLSTTDVIVVDEAAVSVVNARKVQRRLRKRVWGELNEDRIESIRSESVYGHLPSWRLQRVIVKGGDDVRQEVLAGQLVSMFSKIFHEARLPLWLRPYEVVVTSGNSGLIEMIPNTVSIDSLKKDFFAAPLNEIFSQVFADHLEEAQLNFIESSAAYSVVCYLLQVRDRHNGNLLLDSDGHLMHIDFGFMLSSAPGGSFALETSPFKLTQEFIDVMGGEFSAHFETFRTLVIRAFLEARKHRDRICQLVRIVGECNPRLGCFSGLGVEGSVNAMTDRFCGSLTEEACIERIVGLIDESINNWRTIQYDNYQRITNGIL